MSRLTELREFAVLQPLGKQPRKEGRFPQRVVELEELLLKVYDTSHLSLGEELHQKAWKETPEVTLERNARDCKYKTD